MHTVKLDWITPEAEKVIARHARVSTSNPDRRVRTTTLIALSTVIGRSLSRPMSVLKLLPPGQFQLS